ncbi:hypothetical protein D9V79_01450 [Buchnera aphidicola (Stegophylla sp.)]|uniref:Uncharacterized protein n=1 Tax=Buchnera aphidicola (Stegophylla sp.) TaxID=2315800 RepID=A0A4D6YBH0_9GAMM|nr:hypothetical protein D9V79_01450 [Buchnera aphidicola (Stegophylla sp.)]
MSKIIYQKILKNYFNLFNIKINHKIMISNIINSSKFYVNHIFNKKYIKFINNNNLNNQEYINIIKYKIIIKK